MWNLQDFSPSALHTTSASSATASRCTQRWTALQLFRSVAATRRTKGAMVVSPWRCPGSKGAGSKDESFPVERSAGREIVVMILKRVFFCWKKFLSPEIYLTSDSGRVDLFNLFESVPFNYQHKFHDVLKCSPSNNHRSDLSQPHFIWVS